MYITRNTRILTVVLILLLLTAFLIVGVAALHATHHAAWYVLADGSTPDVIVHNH